MNPTHAKQRIVVKKPYIAAANVKKVLGLNYKPGKIFM